MTQVGGQGQYRIDANAHPLGDVSPASEIKIYVTEVRPTTRTTDENDVTPGNVTADLTSEVIRESTAQHNTRGTAERVYQGSPVLFWADLSASNTDVPVLLENVETGEILLDGSTGVNSNTIAFESDNLESGTTYSLLFNENGANPPTANPAYPGETKKFVNITSLRLSASLDQDGTLFEHDEAVNLDVEGDAIRGNSGLAIEVRDSDGNLEEVYSDSLDNRAEFEFSASISSGDISAGDYTVTVIDVETGVEVEAGSFSVDEFPEADSASFDGGVFEEERGDVVEIPITLRNSVEGAQAHVSVGSLGDTNYVTNVTVADQNGDGEVTLLFNSFMAGTENLSAVFQAEGPDTVDNWRGENGTFIEELRVGPGNNNLTRAKNATLDAASYELQVAAAEEGDDFQNFSFSDNEADDVGAIDLGSRSTEDVVTWRVSSEAAGNLLAEGLPYVFDEAGNNLTQTDRITSGEFLIAQIVASGVEGPIKNQTNIHGYNDSAAFLAEADTNGVAGGDGHGDFENYDQGDRVSFTTGFQLDNPEPNEDLRTFALQSTNDFVFLPDYQNDTYYIA
ncbi:MAG: hypothetical protein V5A44_07405, partial [Haloarculaceae archaeon]